MFVLTVRSINAKLRSLLSEGTLPWLTVAPPPNDGDEYVSAWFFGDNSLCTISETTDSETVRFRDFMVGGADAGIGCGDFVSRISGV
jgi:hypothetical protein